MSQHSHIPNALLRVILVAVYSESMVQFVLLGTDLQKYVTQRLVEMAEKGRAETEFEKILVECNPSPARVTNHFKWRVTQPIKIRLQIPRFPLEMDLVRWAYQHEAPHDLTNTDLSGLVFQLRVLCDAPTLLDAVENRGMDYLHEQLRTITPRFRITEAAMVSIRDVIRTYNSEMNDYTEPPPRTAFLEFIPAGIITLMGQAGMALLATVLFRVLLIVSTDALKLMGSSLAQEAHFTGELFRILGGDAGENEKKIETITQFFRILQKAAKTHFEEKKTLFGGAPRILAYDLLKYLRVGVIRDAAGIAIAALVGSAIALFIPSLPLGDDHPSIKQQLKDAAKKSKEFIDTAETARRAMDIAKWTHNRVDELTATEENTNPKKQLKRV